MGDIMEQILKYGLWVFCLGLFMTVAVVSMSDAEMPFTHPQNPTYDISLEIPIQYSPVTLSGLKQWKIHNIQDTKVKESSFTSKFFWGISTGEATLDGTIQGKTGKVSLGKFSATGETKLAVLEIKGLEPGTHKLYLVLKENGVVRASKMITIEI
jgi:hypothetical protein